MKPRSAKAKGTKLERDIADRLAALGIAAARRQPGSGKFTDFAHDVFGRLPDGKFLVECKARRASAWKTGDRWLGAADLLVVKVDGVNQHDNPEPSVYMPWRFFARLIHLIYEGRAHGSVLHPSGPPRVPPKARAGRTIPSRPFPKPKGDR